MTDKKFRVSSGLDASNNKIINVGYPSKENKSDGVNVQFYDDYNTIQQYDPTRGYEKGISVIYDRRIYTATQNITKPAGTFNSASWTDIRNDPSWITINTSSVDGTNIEAGQYVVIDARSNDIRLVLPNNPVKGDMLVIYDGYSKAGLNDIHVKSNGKLISYRNEESLVYRMTVPNTVTTFVFINDVWKVQEIYNLEGAYIASKTSLTAFQMQSGMNVLRKSASGQIVMQLPRFANNNDVIYTYDLDMQTPVNNTTVNVYPESTHKIKIGNTVATSILSKTTGYGIFVFNSDDETWYVHDGDQTIRVQYVTRDVVAIPNSKIYVSGSSVPVNVTLPEVPANGDRVWLTLRNMSANQNCTIKVKDGSSSVINMAKNMTQFPKRSEYPKFTNVKSVTYNATTDYIPNIELAYSSTGNVWYIAEVNPTVEQVDDLHRERLGVIALASQEEANKNSNESPNKIKAITPETLSNRTATEKRLGIARISTSLENNQITEFDYDDFTIVTPKKLNEKIPTETKRGVTEIATQPETDLGTDDIRIVTPKKLHNRKASETLTGILALVDTKTPTEARIRNESGTGVYDNKENTKAVTSKSLSQRVATEKSSGLVFIATETETISGATLDKPVVVTTNQLHKKTATEARIGFVQLATQDETDKGVAGKVITAERLHKRNATETLTGIARLTTEKEFSDGILDTVIVTPFKAKTFFDKESHVIVNEESGLTRTGTIWDTVSLGIKDATELQKGVTKISPLDEVIAGVNNMNIITPYTLENKKATQARFGIVRFATNDESALGEADNIAVTPATMKFLNGSDPSWGATIDRRGAVFISKEQDVFVGDNKQGSTKPYTEYKDSYYAVSPKGLNFALEHFLPKTATASDSDKLKGVDGNLFFRKDFGQTINGLNNYTKTQRFKDIETTDITATGTVLVNATNPIVSLTGEVSTISLAGSFKWDIKSTEQGLFTIGDKLSLSGTKLTYDGIVDSKQSESESYSITDKSLAKVQETKLVLSNKDFSKIVFDTVDYNSVLINDAIVLNDKNFSTALDTAYVLKSGDVMGGALAIKKLNTGFRFDVANNKAILSSGTYGTGTNDLVLNGINDKKLDSINIELNDNTKLMVNNNSVYHKGNKPTPEEINAVNKKDSVVDNLTVVDFIKLGNVRITVNKATKKVEFTWED